MNIITLIIIAIIISLVITSNLNKKEKINIALEDVKNKYPLVETYILDYGKNKFVLLFSDDVDNSYRTEANEFFNRELIMMKVI